VSKVVKKIGPKTFTGILAQPFDQPDELVVAICSYREPEPVKKAIYQAVHEYVTQQKWERLVALADRYGVDLQRGRPSPVLELLFRLAADFVPGFRPDNDSRNSAVGRPRGKNWKQNFELFKSVEMVMHKRGISALSACTNISKDRKSEWHGSTAEALYERYKRSRDQWETRRKERANHPLYARIEEIKRARSGVN
jgi:hypothetical protein